jgi:L-amino acid N-acyltransferase YncA
MLRAACEQTTNLFAVVRDGNQASRRLFESCGFTAACGDGAGFRRYVLEQPEFQRNRA